MSFTAPITVMLAWSRGLTTGLVLAHTMVVAAVFWSKPDAIGSLILPIAACSLYFGLGRHGLRRFGSAPTSVRVEQDGALSVGLRDGSVVKGRILETSFVHPNLTILNLRPHGRRLSRHVILLPDCVDAESFRRLRVWLRWADHARRAEPGPEGTAPFS